VLKRRVIFLTSLIASAASFFDKRIGCWFLSCSLLLHSDVNDLSQNWQGWAPRCFDCEVDGFWCNLLCLHNSLLLSKHSSHLQHWCTSLMINSGCFNFICQVRVENTLMDIYGMCLKTEHKHIFTVSSFSQSSFYLSLLCCFSSLKG